MLFVHLIHSGSSDEEEQVVENVFSVPSGKLSTRNYWRLPVMNIEGRYSLLLYNGTLSTMTI